MRCLCAAVHWCKLASRVSSFPPARAVAGDLHRDGLIKYSRGDIIVLDRAGLEACCSCYAADRQAYSQLLN